ncbi:27 kDa hemolymph protein-like [Anticarsia gemmatalis]|uniref:27 kDa hemolymph protein-like n=1 Tax=Anticarsia gemmatalis TaxID=129554 RepID=UPI003F75DFD8
MMFKAIIFAALAVAVLAEYELPSDKRAQMRELLREQCKKSGAEDKVDEVQNVFKNFVDCLKNLIDVHTVQKEIEEAKPNGALDEVFKKYCAKSPQLKTCLHNLFDGVAPCIGSESLEHLNSAKNSSDQLIDFVCYKDGDRIALFIAEGGPECFQSKASDIKTCADNFKNSFTSLEDAKKLTVAERCAKLDQLKSCVVSKLETCETPTPANMFESLVNFVAANTPCKKHT